MKLEHMTFWFTNGNTARFHEVTILLSDRDSLEIEYKSASDGLIKQATFRRASLAGIGTYEGKYAKIA